MLWDKFGTHLVALYEVEVLPIGTVTMLKVTTLLLTPGTKLFWNIFQIQINQLYISGYIYYRKKGIEKETWQEKYRGLTIENLDIKAISSQCLFCIKVTFYQFIKSLQKRWNEIISATTVRSKQHPPDNKNVQ